MLAVSPPPSLSEEPQDSKRQSGRCEHGLDHPADESGFEINDLGPNLSNLGADASDFGPLFGPQVGDLSRESRVEVGNLRADLGDLGLAGLELVGRNVIALLGELPQGVSEGVRWAGVK